MRLKKGVLGLLFGVLFFTVQGQDEIWYFGASRDGLDFSGGGAPTTIQVPAGKGPSGFYECNASVSDGLGGLLFYTDGLNIYNKDHDVMPNGGGLSGPNEPGQTTGSSSQGVIIVQDPGNSDRYYVLYADCIHNNFADGYRYTIVDMTLDGGDGDVVPGSKDIIIMSGVGQANQVGEFLNAVCLGGTTWVLSHRVGSDEFLAHKIDATGIDLNPVVSAVGPVLGVGNLGQMRGTMSFSHAGNKVALASGGRGVYYFDFNAITGVVSNPVTVHTGGSWYYGTEWSPDDSKIYYTNYIGGPGLSQYDIATASVHTYAGGSLGSIRLAPDGKLYAAPGNPARTALSVINDPDLLGAAANYVQDQQGGFSGGWITLGLPDNFVCLPIDTCRIDSVAEVCDTTSAFQFTANPSGGVWGGGSYITTNGMFDPGSAGGGTHWITYAGGCVGPDSVQIQVNVCCPDITPNLGPDSTICDDLTISLDAGAGMTTYRWYENGVLLVAESGQTLDADSGTYVVEIIDGNGCEGTDTIEIGNHQLPQPDLGVDTFFCVGSDVELDAGPGYIDYAWSTGGALQTETATLAATYSVTVTDANGCNGTDDIVVSENELPEVDLGPDTTVCELDSIILDATHPDADSYAWTPNSESTATIKVGAPDGTYSVTITDVDGCEFTTQRTITQEDLPVVDLGETDTICTDLTKTLDAGSGTNQSYEWFLDGNVLATETNQTLTADSGTYVVRVTTPAGCETSDTVLIDNYQLPIVDLGGGFAYCEGDSVELDAGNPTATFSWSPNGETTQTAWAKTTGVYSVTVTDTNNCVNSDNSTISENANPVIDLGANDSACVGLDIPLDATIPNGVTYVWSNGHAQAIYNLVGPDTLSVFAVDDNGCIGYDTIEIAALDSLVMTFPADNQVCQGSEADNPLNAGSFQGASFTWELPDGNFENGQSIVPLLNGWYTVQVTDEFNCKGIDSVLNVVIPVPNISLGDDTSFCSLGKDSYTVRMEFSEIIPGTIEWSDNLGGTYNDNANDTLFTATYAPLTVIGTFTDALTGCVHIDSVELTEYCEPTIIRLPNIFVPGGTSTGNGTFKPIDMTDETFRDLVNNIVWSDFEIYNRWGLKVFQSDNLIPNWDGMFENRPTASGVYYWIYKYKDTSLKEYTLNGFVQVVQKRD